MEKVVRCLNENDPDVLWLCMYPMPDLTRQEFDTGFDDIYRHWTPTERDDISLISLSVNSRVTADGSQKTYEGTYSLTMRDTPWQLYLVYAETPEEKGLVSIRLAPAEKRAASVTALSVVLTVLYAVVVISIVIDILRRKPRLYGLRILMALLLTFWFSVNSVRVTIPLGALLYWVERPGRGKKRNQQELVGQDDDGTPPTP